MKPGPKPDPALRAGDPRWFRRGLPNNGPENFDPFEPRFYCGRPASHLACHAADYEERRTGYIRPGARERIRSLTWGFINALGVYLKIKRALYMILCPFRFRRRGLRRAASPQTFVPPPLAPKLPKSWKKPSRKDWAELNGLYGFDVRMTSPVYIIRRAKRLRHILWDAPDKDVAKENPAKTGIAQKAGRKRAAAPDLPVREPEDLFAIWPPISLPDLPRSVRIKAGKSLDDIRRDSYATPRPAPLFDTDILHTPDNHIRVPDYSGSASAQSAPGSGQARASPD